MQEKEFGPRHSPDSQPYLRTKTLVLQLNPIAESDSNETKFHKWATTPKQHEHSEICVPWAHVNATVLEQPWYTANGP